MNKGLTYPKTARLLKRRQFLSIQRNGRKCRGAYFSFEYAPSATPKLGITVTKKFGKAHERNRAKRIFREAFRHIKPSLKEFTLHIRPAKEAKILSAEHLRQELEKALQQKNLIKA